MIPRDNVAMRSKMSLIIVLLFSIILPNQMALGSEVKPAFAAPDGRQVPQGHWQVFFTPSFLSPLSYLPVSSEPGRNGFSSILPPCSGIQQACISSVEYQVDGGKWETATSGTNEGQRALAGGYLNGPNNWVFVPSATFNEQLSIGRPEGATARLWTFPNAPHAGSDKYQVAVTFSGQVTADEKFSIDSFNAEVTPVTRVIGNSGGCLQPSIWEERAQFSNDGYCKTVFDFPENIRVRVNLNLGVFLDEIQGWFDGRLSNANIRIDSSSRTMQIEGSPLKVPTAAIRPIKLSEIPRNYPGAPDRNVIATQGQSIFGIAGNGHANSKVTLNTFITMNSDILPQALGENTVWKISSISNQENQECVQPGIVNGIVLTNATVYNASAPKWVSARSSLDFQVAATHHDSKGEVFKGYYKMLLNEQVAECLWGQDFSRGTASISITNKDGSPNVATTNLGSRDGWVNFEAAGFTFSSPVISATIKKAEVVAPPKAPPAQDAVVIKKVKKVTCISPKKKTKILSGLNPKCPTGYKKK
jgi:hypothetical protein